MAVAKGKWCSYTTAVTKPNFFVFENNSKGVILGLPFEAHTIQAVITKKGFLNRFKLAKVSDDELKTWARRNIGPLSQIAWFTYDQGRFSERMVATNLVRQLDIDIDKYSGWAFLPPELAPLPRDDVAGLRSSGGRAEP